MAPTQTISLASGWRFKQTQQDDDTWQPVYKVPTVVHLDLLKNGMIPDPFIDTNELDVEWVGERSWTYQVDFATPEIPPGASVFLILEGLDTYAEVHLNGIGVLGSENMFISHRVEVTKHLLGGESNVLSIDFDSALLRGRDLQERHKEHRFIAHNGESGRLAVRKAQYHWGWDWGPVLMTAGPWRPVSLEISEAYIEHSKIDYHLSRDLEKACGTVHVQTQGQCNEIVASIHLGATEVTKVSGTVDATGKAVLPFEIDNVGLWFPAGYGSQILYEVEISVLSRGQILSSKKTKTGFRRTELIQKPDSHGQSFYFRINDIDVFCGGSCWIPADSFLPQVTPEKYRDWLQLMVDGNQIMTRVWGGGIYEEDVFYDICDELGILVWQDFMFACGSYPTWESLRESVEREARQNVQRLQHHPSVVVYAGNNEDYQIQEWYDLDYDYDNKDPETWLKGSFPARYYYEHLLPKVVAEESPSALYWASSPFSGGKHTSDLTVGDLHQWNVWHGTQEKYQRYGQIGGRFNSEFGLAAFPHLDTVRHFVQSSSELYPQSKTLDFHNKADGHERRIATYVVENFRIAEGLGEYSYLTQLAQSEAMAYAYRDWRREWGEDRKCGGALVWQLNDCWPATSWAIVDYFLRKKGAYYTISRALRPVVVGVKREHHDWSVCHARPAKFSSYKVWVSSNLQTNTKVDLELRFVSISTGKDIQPPLRMESRDVGPNGTTIMIDSGSTDNITQEPHVLFARILLPGSVECLSRDADWPQPFKYLDLSDRGLRIETSADSYTVTSLRPVKGLIIEERDGVVLSDNCIDIMPGDTQVIRAAGGAVQTPGFRHLGLV